MSEQLSPMNSYPYEDAAVDHDQLRAGGEYTLSHIDGPSAVGSRLTRLDALKASFAMGDVTIGMNGSLSPEAQAWNSENNQADGPYGDFIYRVNVRGQ